MNAPLKAARLARTVAALAKKRRKASGFCIGNTAKIDSQSLYFTPLRDTNLMVVAGVIVYSEAQAVQIARAVDGKVDRVLVDAEKKIPDELSMRGDTANVERAVRETLKRSALWIYKGNDLSVEAVDCLLTQLTKSSVRGIGGKKAAILGAGNLGSKLALKLVERGASVAITRRDVRKLRLITEALNCIKPAYTTAKVQGLTDNRAAAANADILIGTTNGKPVITAQMVRDLAPGAFIVDVGKGVFFPSALREAERIGIPIHRLDITAAFEGLINELFAIERIVERRQGRKFWRGESIVSGGLLGRRDEVVVDNIHRPRVVYGIADGRGDFLRTLSPKQLARLRRIQEIVKA